MQIFQLAMGFLFIFIAVAIIAPDIYRKLAEYNARSGPSNRKWTDPGEVKHYDPSVRAAITDYDTKSTRRSDTSSFFRDD